MFKRGLLFTVVCVYLRGLYFRVYGFNPEVLNSVTFNGPTCKVRITSYSRVFLMSSGPVYKFESRPVGSSQWREFLSFEQDDLIDIGPEWVKFVDNNVAFVYIGWMFAVSTDGGHQWSVWNGSRDEHLRDELNYKLIESVAINLDGSGEMLLKLSSMPSDRYRLTTVDYGKNWSPSS